MALELGMEPGTCRALGAMYKQLHWAFKVAEAAGGVPPTVSSMAPPYW